MKRIILLKKLSASPKNGNPPPPIKNNGLSLTSRKIFSYSPTIKCICIIIDDFLTCFVRIISNEGLTSFMVSIKNYTGSTSNALLRCVKARVQNLMKNGIQNLICMHFNLLFCKNHHEILTVNANHHC